MKKKKEKESLFTMRRKEDEKGKKSMKIVRCPKARQTLGKWEKWLFLFLIMEQNWLSVRAAAEGRGGDEDAARSG